MVTVAGMPRMTVVFVLMHRVFGRGHIVTIYP